MINKKNIHPSFLSNKSLFNDWIKAFDSLVFIFDCLMFEEKNNNSYLKHWKFTTLSLYFSQFFLTFCGMLYLGIEKPTKKPSSVDLKFKIKSSFLWNIQSTEHLDKSAKKPYNKSVFQLFSCFRSFKSWFQEKSSALLSFRSSAVSLTREWKVQYKQQK